MGNLKGVSFFLVGVLVGCLVPLPAIAGKSHGASSPTQAPSRPLLDTTKAPRSTDLCGMAKKIGPGTPSEICLVRGQIGTSFVKIDGVPYRVTKEDDVHSEGAVSLLTFTDDHGHNGTATVSWVEGWVDGSVDGLSFSVAHLAQR